MIERDTEYIVDADLLAMRILEELPTNRGEAYYALSMALEMIESEKTPLSEYLQVVKDECEGHAEPLDFCGHTSLASQKDDGKRVRFDVQIEAHGVDDLREQIGDLFAYTYSEDFSDSVETYGTFEYDSVDRITRVNYEDMK